MALSVRVTGLAEAAERIGGMAERLADLSPVLDVAASDLKTHIDDRFDTSTGPDGKAWDPLSAATIKKRRQGSSKPLDDTGLLRNSISATGGKRSIRFGTNVPYASPHQFGGEHIPARPFFPVSPAGALIATGPAGEELDAIKAAISHYITTGEVT